MEIYYFMARLVGSLTKYLLLEYVFPINIWGDIFSVREWYNATGKADQSDIQDMRKTLYGLRQPIRRPTARVSSKASV